MAQGCRCYTADELRQLADAITGFHECRLELDEKSALIQSRLVENQAATPSLAWWQHPYVVISGVAVSVTFGAVFALALKH